jgi:Holliday junction resolvase RusA-like endonuclease
MTYSTSNPDSLDGFREFLSQPIRIVVDGAAVPYSERTRIGVRRGGKKLAVWSYRPDKVSDYQTVVRWAAQAAMKGRAPLDGAVSVRVAIFSAVPPSWSKKRQAEALAGKLRPGKPDWDNIAKAVGDALSTIAFADDAQVAEATISKRYDLKPRLEIEVELL